MQNKKLIKIKNKGYSLAGASHTKRALKGFNAQSGSPNEDINYNNRTLRQRSRTPSVAKNPSAIESLLLAESSSVRSNHWVAEVIAGLRASIITYLEREAILSLLMGLRLYAIAEDPI